VAENTLNAIALFVFSHSANIFIVIPPVVSLWLSCQNNMIPRLEVSERSLLSAEDVPFQHP